MIFGYVGPNRSGKTVLAVDDVCKRAARRGVPVYSTVPIDWPGVDVFPVESWHQVLNLENVEILLDEVVVLASSRQTSTLPPDVIAWMGSTSHVGVRLTWTAPAWARADVTLREVTDRGVLCSAWWKSRHEEPDGRRRTIISQQVMYDTEGMEAEWPKEPMRSTRRWHILSRVDSFGRFDTHHKVRLLSEFATVCPDCGLDKPRPRCRCKTDVPVVWMASGGGG